MLIGAPAVLCMSDVSSSFRLANMATSYSYNNVPALVRCGDGTNNLIELARRSTRTACHPRTAGEHSPSCCNCRHR